MLRWWCVLNIALCLSLVVWVLHDADNNDCVAWRNCVTKIPMLQFAWRNCITKILMLQFVWWNCVIKILMLQFSIVVVHAVFFVSCSFVLHCTWALRSDFLVVWVLHDADNNDSVGWWNCVIKMLMLHRFALFWDRVSFQRPSESGLSRISFNASCRDWVSSNAHIMYCCGTCGIFVHAHLLCTVFEGCS